MKKLLLIGVLLLCACFSKAQSDCGNEPTQPSSNVSILNITSSEVFASFNIGNGDIRVIFVRENLPVNVELQGCIDASTFANLHRNATYSASEFDFGEGNFLIGYYGNELSSPQTITSFGLKPGTNYHFVVFEGKYSGGFINFLTSSYLTFSVTTIQCNSNRPTNPSQNLIASSITGNTLDLSWTPGNGNMRMVVANEAFPVSYKPIDGTPCLGSCNSPNPINLDNQIINNRIVYYGNGNSLKLEGLKPGTRYYFSIFEVNTCGWKFLIEDYLSNDFTTECSVPTPTLNVTDVSLTNISNISYNLNFLGNGNGNARVIIAKEGSPVDRYPADCYSFENEINTFPFGYHPIENNNYILFAGSTPEYSPSVPILGLTPGKTYYLSIFEANYIKYGNEYRYKFLTTNSKTISVTVPNCTKSEPTIPSSNMVFSDVSSNGVTLNWQAGNGTSRLVLVNYNSEPDASWLLDDYDLSKVLANPNNVILSPNIKGTYFFDVVNGSNLKLNNLYGGTLHVKIIEYNTSCGIDYNLTNTYSSSICIPPPSLINASSTTSCYYNYLWVEPYDPNIMDIQWFKDSHIGLTKIEGATHNDYFAFETGSYVARIKTTCTTIYTQPINVEVQTIDFVLDLESISICYGQTEFPLQLSINKGSPDSYKITWGDMDQPGTEWTPLSGNQIQVSNWFGGEVTPSGIFFKGKVWLKNSRGCTASKKINLSIIVPPDIGNFTFPKICSGTSSTAISYSYVNGSPNQYRIDWQTLTDVPWTTLPPDSIPITGLPATPGTYYGWIYVRNSSGCEISKSIQVNVKANPSITPSSIAPVCSGVTSSSIPITGATGSPDQYRIDWATLTDIPWTTLPPNAITITGLPTAAGTYTGTLFVRNTYTGCESNAFPISVTVNPKPNVTSANKTICSGESSSLLLTSDVGGAIFNWTVQSKSANITHITVGTTGTSNPINHTLTNTSTNPGTVVYRVTPTASGCTGTFKDITVTVNPPVIASITGNSIICSGNSTTLSANPSGTGYTYLWSTGSTQRSITITTPGTYSVTVFYNGCASVPVTQTTQVTAGGHRINVDGDLCNDGRVILTAGQGYSYSWSTGATFKTIVVYEPGTYVVSYYSDLGCYGTAEVSFTMGGLACIYAIRSTPEEEFGDEINIYPNPVSSELHIKLGEAARQPVDAAITDMHGRMVMQLNLPAGRQHTILDTRHLNPGMYLLQLRQGAHTIRKKLMIVHNR